ncbi:MAG TPA: MBL fold metallo-hydrolase [Acidimicrobiales bacterium]|nr:MBL fold metallo-hydrolase [Acidimicrobiales bacterium]
MGLNVTVLGCAGSYPGPGQACSSYLVRTSSTTIWLDAGSGSLANLQRHVDITDVDAVVLSHEHPDHTGDLAGFYVACKYYLRRERVPVYAPSSVRDTVYYSGAPIDWHEISDGGQVDIGGLHLSFSRTDHPPETLAVRADGDGRSLGYSADTGPAWSLSQLGPGLDLAICEATYLSDSEGRAQHMSARQAGLSGREAGVGRLVLTHQQPGTDIEAVRAEGSAAFGKPVDIAAEGAVFEV